MCLLFEPYYQERINLYAKFLGQNGGFFAIFIRLLVYSRTELATGGLDVLATAETHRGLKTTVL